MTDEHRRELERRWKETGAHEDEAAFLLERVRAGELTQEQLELAAYCAHEGARIALGGSAPTSPKDLRQWVRGFAAWGKRRVVGLALLCVQPAVGKYQDQSWAGIQPAEQALAAARAWLDDPSPETRLEAQRVSEVSMETFNANYTSAPYWDTNEQAERRTRQHVFRAAIFVATAAGVEPHAQTPNHAVERYLATKASRAAAQGVELASFVIGRDLTRAAALEGVEFLWRLARV